MYLVNKADNLAEACPELQLSVFTDRDIAEDPGRVERALETADAFFGSLVFDYDQVNKNSIVSWTYRTCFQVHCITGTTHSTSSGLG